MHRKVCSDTKFKEESHCVLRGLKYIYVEIGTVVCTENSRLHHGVGTHATSTEDN